MGVYHSWLDCRNELLQNKKDDKRFTKNFRYICG